MVYVCIHTQTQRCMPLCIALHLEYLYLHVCVRERDWMRVRIPPCKKVGLALFDRGPCGCSVL